MSSLPWQTLDEAREIASGITEMINMGDSVEIVEAAVRACGLMPHDEKVALAFAKKEHERRHPPRVDPNDIPAFAMPLRDLVTMWEAKFGDKWVDVSVVRDEPFWQQAIDRMGAAHLFEQYAGHYKIKDL